MDLQARTSGGDDHPVTIAFARPFPADASPPTGGMLASLAGGPMAGRFCAWRGASDRRYVATVFPVDRGRADGGLPDFDRFVLIAVAKGPGRVVLSVRIVERRTDRKGLIATALGAGADEWHVHLLTEDRAAREAAVADLRARHDPYGSIARCA